MYNMEQEWNWRIELFGKFNRIYQSVAVLWEDCVTDEVAYDIFLELMDSTPPKLVVTTAMESPEKLTAYEARLICTDNHLEAAHLHWPRGLVAALVDDYREADFVEVKCEFTLTLPREVAENPDDWDLTELAECGYIERSGAIVVPDKLPSGEKRGSNE